MSLELKLHSITFFFCCSSSYYHISKIKVFLKSTGGRVIHLHGHLPHAQFRTRHCPTSRVSRSLCLRDEAPLCLSRSATVCTLTPPTEFTMVVITKAHFKSLTHTYTCTIYVHKHVEPQRCTHILMRIHPHICTQMYAKTHIHTCAPIYTPHIHTWHTCI